MKYALLLLLLVVSSTVGFGAPRFAVSSGQWNQTSTWSSTAGGGAGFSVPVAGDDVTINAGVVVTVTAAAACGDLTVTGTLTFNSGFDLTMGNGGNVMVSAAGVLIFDANGQLVGGNTNANGVVVKFASGAGLRTANVQGFVAAAGNNVAITTGSITVQRGTRTAPTYNIAGLDYTYFAGAAQAVGSGPLTATSIADLNVLTTTTLTVPAAFTSTGVVTVDGTSTLTLNALNMTLSGGGTPYVNNGTLNSTGTVIFSSGSTQTIGGSPAFNNLQFGGTGAETISTGSNITVNNNWASGTATVTMSGDASISVTNAVTGVATITMGSGVMTLNGATTTAFGNTGTFNRGTGTVIYNRAGTQTVKQTTYNNLVLDGTSAKTTTTVTVNGTLYMQGATTVSVSAVPTYAGTAALVYSSTAAKSAGVEWGATFAPTGGITIGGTGAVSMAADKSLSTGVALTINGGATLTAAAFDLTMRDDFVNNGTWTSSTGDVTVTGTAGQFIGAFSTTGLFTSTKTTGGVATLTGDIKTGNLTINGATGTVNLGTGRTHEVVGAITLTSGSLNGGTSILRVGGNWTGTGTLFVPGTGTVEFYRGAQTLSASGVKTFNNLTFSGGGNKSISAGSTLVNGILSLEDIAAPATTFPTYGPNARLRYNTATGRTAGAEWLATFSASGGVVIDNTGTIAIGANKAFGVNAPFIIENGATFNAGSFDMSFSNDFIKNGTGVWTSNSGDVTVTGAGTQSIAGLTTSGIFTTTKTGGVATLNGNLNSGGFSNNGPGGTVDLGTGLTHTFSGPYITTNGTVLVHNSTVNMDGAVIVNAPGGVFTPDIGSTVNFRANVPQSIPGINLWDVGFSGTGLKTFTGSPNVYNVMTVSNGTTVDMAAGNTLQLLGSGTPLVLGPTAVLNTGTSTVTYAGAAITTIVPINYHNLIGSVGADRVLATTATIGVSGAFTPVIGTGGVYTVAGSTVDFNGTAAQTIPTFTFDKLIVSNGSIKRILATIVVACQSIDINDTASVEINADGMGRLNITGP